MPSSPEKQNAYAKEWRAKNKAKSAAYRKANAEKRRLQHAAWVAENRDRARELHREWSSKNRDKTRLKCKLWYENNREYARQSMAGYEKANRSKVNAIWARKRAARANATPDWLTLEHHRQIEAVYAEAQRLSRETGIAHHVDHIVPLQGSAICGLHVPWNLRAIPAVENLKKHNKVPLAAEVIATVKDIIGLWFESRYGYLKPVFTGLLKRSGTFSAHAISTACFEAAPLFAVNNGEF